MHEQVREGMRNLIVSGAITAEEKLPAVREMAELLAINPNTIARAYRDLEAEGYIYTVAGKGSFAAAGNEVDRSRRDQLLHQWEGIGKELLFLGLTVESLTVKLQAIGGGAL